MPAEIDDTDGIDDILRGAAERIGASTSCSVIMRQGGGYTRVASSDARSAACDDAEVSEGRGPCVLAMDQLSGVIVPDITEEDRWAGWGATAIEQGFRSAAALPAYVSDDVVASINLYSDLRDPWDAEALVRADVEVQRVAAAVAARLH